MLTVQRAPAEAAQTADAASANPTAAPARPRLLVDDAAAARPEQVPVALFMARVRARLTEMCDAELAAVGRSARGCPYLQTWLAYYERRSAAQVERAVRLYAGPTEDTAEGLLEAVVSRVRAAVRIWIATGGITGVPPGVTDLAVDKAAELAVAGPLGLFLKLEAGAAAAPAGAAPHPAAVQARLGAGQPLEGGARSRMERAFGRSFAGVRVHTESAAVGMAGGFSARAFTVGNHIAFGAGQYRPGTIVGDLLLAHELAHTVQQSGPPSAAGPELRDAEHFEDDADEAAADAVLGGQARPRQHGGLSLQGCKPKAKRCPKGKAWTTEATAPGVMVTCVCTYSCQPAPTGSGGGASGYSDQSTVRCHGYCPSTEYEDFGGSYQREGKVVEKDPGRVRGVGGYSTPIGAQHVCLCPGVDIEGEDRAEGIGVAEVLLDIGDLAPTPRNRTTGLPEQPSRPRPGPGKQPAPISAPKDTTPKGPVNWRGQPVRVPAGHTMSPRDPPMHEPPIIKRGPFTDEQRNAFLDGKAGDTKLAPHHRHQIPTSHGGVIDELRGPGHPQGNEHTAGSPSRHPSGSVFGSLPDGEKLRKDEIKDHWRRKGERLVPSNGMWIDPGPSKNP